jgi:hypothetical protein
MTCPFGIIISVRLYGARPDSCGSIIMGRLLDSASGLINNVGSSPAAISFGEHR